MMKRLIIFLSMAVGLFGADAANDVILTQRKADNSGNTQRNVAPVASGLLTFDASKIPTSPAGFTLAGTTFGVPDAFAISSAGSIALTAGGTNRNITLTPSGTGSIVSVLGTNNIALIGGSGATNPRFYLASGTTGKGIAILAGSGGVAINYDNTGIFLFQKQSRSNIISGAVSATEVARFEATTDAFVLASTTEATIAGAASIATGGGIYAAKKAYAAGGNIGTITNTTQPAGNIGERRSSVVAVGSAISLSTGTAANVGDGTTGTVTLTPGNWIVWGKVNFALTGATSTDYIAGLSTTSATLGDATTYNESPFSTTALSGDVKMSVPMLSFSVAVASTTKVYLVAQSTFSVGSETAYGEIYALRTD